MFYCIKCKTYHKDGYKKHWKYKKETTELSEIERMKYIEECFAETNLRIEKLEGNISKIVELLEQWANYMGRKHPYWKPDDDFYKWVKENRSQ